MVESLRRFRDSLGEPVGNLHPARLTLPESEGTAPNGVVPPRQATGGLTPPASLESEGNGAKGKVHPPNAVLDDLRQNGPSKIAKIADRVGKSYSNVSSQLVALKKRGLAVNDSSARWYAETDETRSWPRLTAGIVKPPRPEWDDDDDDAADTNEDIPQPEIKPLPAAAVAAPNDAPKCSPIHETGVSSRKTPAPIHQVAAFIQQRPDDDPADDPEMFATVLAVLPTGRRDVVNRARCRTARELAAFGRTSLTALPGCGSNTCEHIEDWLSLHFGISLAR